jgi:hypothetical protein
VNGKKAKELRKKASELILSLGMSLSEGNREYKQAMNCRGWDFATNKDGSRMYDTDGVALLKPVANPGTLRSEWHYKVFYKFLKNLYKRKGDKDAQKILNASGEELKRMFREREA